MQKKIKVNDIIFEKIKFRYDLMNLGYIHNRKHKTKLMLDSFYPYAVARSIKEGELIQRILGIGTNGYAISERVVEDMSCKQLHISELTSMLGYTKTDITKLLQIVKHKNYKIVLVGLGGTGSNFLHWMYEMCNWTGKTEIFAEVFGADNDDYDVPNMLRIPFIPENSTEVSSLKAYCIPKKFRYISARYDMQNMLIDQTWLDNVVYPTGTTFVYGAPDITTRQFLSESRYTFFAATHRDNEYSIVENPTVDNELMMETYGKINLSRFFLNHLSMTIDFLTHLSTRVETMEEQRENETVVREDFRAKYSAEMEAGFKSGSKKLFAVDAIGLIEDLALQEEA